MVGFYCIIMIILFRRLQLQYIEVGLHNKSDLNDNVGEKVNYERLRYQLLLPEE